MAGTAIGLTTAQTYRYILLPLAYRIIFPPLTSEFLNTIKNTAVALTIGLHRAHRARACDAGIFVPGFRGLHGRDRHLSAAQRRRDLRHAPLEKRLAVPGFNGGK